MSRGQTPTPGAIDDVIWRGFASDNYAGVHPAVLAAIQEANAGHAAAYGDDPLTMRLDHAMRDLFGGQAQTFPVFNGTGANVVALQAMCRSWEAVICTANAHIQSDEGGAPEKVAGLKLHTVVSPDGKLTPELMDEQAWGIGDVHRAQPRVVSITQSSELGTVYTPDEIAELTEHAHGLGLYVHLDGARIANATASLNVPVRAFTTDAGVDIVSFGGTKNGAMLAEAVVVLRPELAPAIPFLRKSAMQLSSKMRFVSAQLLALLTDDLWLANARHSNAMAQRLASGVQHLPGVHLPLPVQANGVFPVLPSDVIPRLQQRARFYVWDARIGQVRWMCAWDTTDSDVDQFIDAVREELSSAR